MGLRDRIRRLIRKRPDKPSETSLASSSSRASNNQKYCLEVLHDGSNADLDIVFVHGLNGDHYDTWCHGEGESEVYWPKQFLKEDLPNTRIMSYGYDARTHSFSSRIAQVTFDGFAEGLLTRLAHKRIEDRYAKRKICFVAHSLGGLVVANSLTLKVGEENLKRIQDNTTGVLLLGVPLWGSDIANTGNYLRGLLRYFLETNSNNIFRYLEPSSEKLSDVRRRFLTLLRISKSEGNEIRPTFFYEYYEVPGFGMIVPKSSATTEDRTSVQILADHRNMTKFPSSSDRGYELIKGELLEQIKHACNQDVARKRSNTNTKALITNNGGYHGRSTSPIPRCVCLPRSVSDFVGRREKLEEVHQMVGVSNLAVALVGLAGIGKSRLAIKFANEYFEKSPNTWVFWVQAGSKAQLQMGYRRIAKSLGIADHDAPNIMDLVTDYLSCTMQNKWLLIFDNVDDLSIASEKESERVNIEWLKKFLFSHKNGYTLITTCNKKLAEDLNTEVIDVFELRLEDARVLLKSKMRKRNNSDTEEDIDELLKKLDCIPLAIVQAAIFLNNNKFYPIKKYLKDLQSKGSYELVKHLDQKGRPYEGFEQRKPIVQTLHSQISYIWNEDKKDNKNQGAAKLLSQMSFCDRQSISEIMFEDEPQITENVRKLMDYSLVFEVEYAREQTVVSFTNKKEERTFAMHNLVQRATRAWVEMRKESEIQMNCLISNLYKKFPDRKDYDFIQCQTMSPHVQEVFSMSKLQEEVEGRLFEDKISQIRKLRTIAKSYKTQVSMQRNRDEWQKEEHRWQEAENTWKEVLECAKELPDKDERLGWFKAVCLSMLSCYWLQGKLEEASDFLERRLGDSDNIDDVAWSLSYRLAWTYHYLKRYEDAKEILRQLLHPNNSRSNLYVQLAEHSLDFLCYEVPELQDSDLVEKESEMVKKDSQEVIRRSHRAGKPNCFRQGAIYKAAISVNLEGRVDEAISMMKDCCKGRESVYGSTNPILQDSLLLLKTWEEERDQREQNCHHRVEPLQDGFQDVNIAGNTTKYENSENTSQLVSQPARDSFKANDKNRRKSPETLWPLKRSFTPWEFSSLLTT